jgi:hypothetical protein
MQESLLLSKFPGRVAADLTGAHSDRELLQRVAAGDARAMEVLYARHRGKLYRFLLRLVGHAANAEDLTSEVFLGWRSCSMPTDLMLPLEVLHFGPGGGARRELERVRCVVCLGRTGQELTLTKFRNSAAPSGRVGRARFISIRDALFLRCNGAICEDGM